MKLGGVRPGVLTSWPHSDLQEYSSYLSGKLKISLLFQTCMILRSYLCSSWILYSSVKRKAMMMINLVKLFEMPWEKLTNFQAWSNFKRGHAGGAGVTGTWPPEASSTQNHFVGLRSRDAKLNKYGALVFNWTTRVVVNPLCASASPDPTGTASKRSVSDLSAHGKRHLDFRPIQCLAPGWDYKHLQ